MTPGRFREITSRYRDLTLGIVGDFCLDRYLEIDPSIQEVSIETGLPVHNVTRVRSQPGAAGTILNNLIALGIGKLEVVGFCGLDGEGYELQEALKDCPRVSARHFRPTRLRRTFTYCKPLLMHPSGPPQELNRLDSKNFSPTPKEISHRLSQSLQDISGAIDGLIVMDQVDLAETGVVTKAVRDKISDISAGRPALPIVADSRRSLKHFPAVAWKMNAAELGKLLGGSIASIAEVQRAAADLSERNGKPVFVSMSELGIVGAAPGGFVAHAAAHSVRGPIDIVGAGDAVTANLTAAMAAGAELQEALELSMAAASVVIHQLGTTGTATVENLAVFFN